MKLGLDISAKYAHVALDPKTMPEPHVFERALYDGEIVFDEYDDFVARARLRLPNLLPMVDEHGQRTGVDRWGLDYRHTFRRRKDALRAIRKGLV